MKFMKDMADKAGLGDVVDKIEGVAEGALGKLFQPILDSSVDNALKFLGPKAGEVAAEKMIEKYSALKNVNGAKDAAVDAGSKAVMSFKDDILDFVQDAVDDPQGTFKKVGVLLLRAAKDAAEQSVKALLALIPGCCAVCIKMFANLKDVIQEVYNSVKQALEDFVNEQLKSKHVPSAIMDKIKWDFSPEDDVGEPKKKRARDAPQPETMGAASSS
mmetsp:Transcript_88389/g.234749  ORF Transcript_88389/g.234749 Transcript_88389/m.234749 type:complete len:216 (-) Transcript_88389:42-689(-)